MQQSPRGLHHVTRPPGTPGPEPHPALVLLHGRGADEQDLLPMADELDPRLYVISIRAPLPLPPGYAWYHLLDLGNPEPSSFTRSLDLLAIHIQELAMELPIDPARIYTLGFSQGAMMAGSLFMTHPELTAGTMMLSGYLPLGVQLPVDEAKLAGRPIFQAHGTVDPVLSIALGRAARGFLTRVKADLTYHEYPIGHTIGAREMLDVANWLVPRL